MELAGNWDARPLLENVRNADFDLVILAGSGPDIVSHRGVTRFDPAVVEALNGRYERLCESPRRRGVNGAMVLEPRGRPAQVTAEMMSRTLNRPCFPDEPGRAPGVFIRPNDH